MAALGFTYHGIGRAAAPDNPDACATEPTARSESAQA